MIPAVLNHLWQSTLCLAVIAALTLRLRRNGANVRYWLWFAASMKFLLPFALLVALGQQLAPGWVALDRVAPAITLSAGSAVQHLAAPFGAVTPGIAMTASAASANAGSRTATSIRATPTLAWQEIAGAIWALGGLGCLLHWAVRWRSLRSLIRESQPLPLAGPVAVRSSASAFEPSLIGILRPVLLIPRCLTEQLSREEIRSVLAHELCHLRRRDNLTYAIHLLVQTVFWFYPPLWWLGTRLLRERERACDEGVLAAGHQPEVYAQSILKVCRICVGAPVVGTAGVSGSDLKERVRRIVGGWHATPLSGMQKLLVSGLAAAALWLPVGLGLIVNPAADAQDAAGSGYSAPAGPARQDYLQTRPQKEVPFDPAAFDAYQGYYAFAPMYFAHVFRRKDRYYMRLTGEHEREIFPESPTKFFATLVALQVSFVTDTAGRVRGLVLHQDGFLRSASRVAPSTALEADSALSARIRRNAPSPESEAYARRMIDGMESGEPDYQDMDPLLAYAYHLNLAKVRALMRKLGPLKSIAFDRVDPTGLDVYVATFAHGRTMYDITPLAFSADGKVVAAYFSSLP
jgi:beta-lactamase regulating signal transducer with metallopeptidase domain